MSYALDPLLPDPDEGTWVRPDQWPPAGLPEGFDPTTQHHDPVVSVTLATPNGEDSEGVVSWEAWRVAPVSGDVSWSAEGFPRGTARVEIPPADQWAPARDHPDQPEEPSISPGDEIPWAAGPWGTLVLVHYGWQTSAGVYGVRVFDGMVTHTSMARPGRTWVLDCADFTTLMDGFIPHDKRRLRRLSGPPSKPYGLDYGSNLGFREAVRWLARESSEYWWPMPSHQLSYDDPDENQGIYDFDWNGEDVPYIDGETDMGGQSAWSWVEEWCDGFGFEAAIVPGGRGLIVVAEPRDTQDDDPRLTLTTGAGGNLIAWTADYDRIITRAHMTLHTREPINKREDMFFLAWRGEYVGEM